jgi:hypothetical protein
MFMPMALTCAEAVNTSTELFHHWRGDFLGGENWFRKSIHARVAGFRVDAKVTEGHN